MNREQMVSEFGEPGVENARMVDLITVDKASGAVALVMIERRPWGASPRQFDQIQEKINRYLGYVLDGFLAEQYPQYEGKRVQIRLECAEPPYGEALKFVNAAEHAIGVQGLDFIVTTEANQPT